MKEKIKKFRETFKELWKIPRYNALIKLGLYFVFFLVFGSIFVLNRVPKKKNPEKEITINKNSYEFSYNINDNIIKGKKNKNITFTYNDIEYTIEDENITCDLDDCNIEFKYIFDFFTLDKIEDYIKNGELISKTEYTTGDIEYKYNINNSKIMEYFNSENGFEIIKNNNKYTINLENYNILDKIILEYK